MSGKRIVIIGAGPGGISSALHAARLGAEVSLIESEALGGVCLNRGCIPSKILLETSHLMKQMKDAKSKSLLSSDASVIWENVQKDKRESIYKIREISEKHLKSSKVNIIKGMAKFNNGREIEISSDGKISKVEFDTAVIATGTVNFVPKLFNNLGAFLFDSDGALEIEKLPKSILIVGGGAIGCEFACLFNDLGVEVTIVEKMPTLLPGEPPEITALLKRVFEKEGMKIVTDSTVKSAEITHGKLEVKCENGETISSEKILVCVGRKPFFNGLNLASAGVSFSEKGIEINNKLETSAKNIYAIGDVTTLPAYAHGASFQGEIAVENSFGGLKEFDIDSVPKCIFTRPEVASVGLDKERAESSGLAVKSQRSFFMASARAIGSKQTGGFIQIISEEKTGKIIGAQIVGPHATELIHIISIAMKAGMKREDFKSVIFAHPTFSESIREAFYR